MGFLWQHFREGGWGMWPILFLLFVTIWIIYERSRYLFTARAEQAQLVTLLRKLLMQGNVAGAIAACQQSGKPVAKIVEAGLRNLHRDDEHVQNAMDAVALAETAKIESKTGYLAMLGNVATLMGLLGTITGLIKSFAGVGVGAKGAAAVAAAAHQVSQSSKAEMLAAGISEAMNCTAFGLIAGILALLGYSVLNGRTQLLIDEINETAVSILNLATGHRQAMNLEPLKKLPPTSGV